MIHLDDNIQSCPYYPKLSCLLTIINPMQLIIHPQPRCGAERSFRPEVAWMRLWGRQCDVSGVAGNAWERRFRGSALWFKGRWWLGATRSYQVMDITRSYQDLPGPVGAQLISMVRQLKWCIWIPSTTILGIQPIHTNYAQKQISEVITFVCR